MKCGALRRQCGLSALRGTQSAATYPIVIVLRKNPVWPISFDLRQVFLLCTQTLYTKYHSMLKDTSGIIEVGGSFAWNRGRQLRFSKSGTRFRDGCSHI